jgi:hypothetical protein
MLWPSEALKYRISRGHLACKRNHTVKLLRDFFTTISAAGIKITAFYKYSTLYFSRSETAVRGLHLPLPGEIRIFFSQFGLKRMQQ